MDRFAALTGRQYHLFDYFGDPDAERVVVLMGSSALAAEECVEALRARGEKVGLINVHLFRPFSAKAFVDALPRTVRAIAVLDRTKEPGSAGEPLYQDVVMALHESDGFVAWPRVIRGRYGLASKEFTPAMCAAVFEELAHAEPAQAVRGRHPRRCFQSQPVLRREVLHRRSRDSAGGLLRAGRGRNGRRQQEFHQDHRRGYRTTTRRATSFMTRRSPAP